MSELSTMLHVLRTPQDLAGRQRVLPVWEFATVVLGVMLAGVLILVEFAKWL